ncbi:MAG: DUF58 domain-containing protein [Candidatus Odinarchaeia archaeon]
MFTSRGQILVLSGVFFLTSGFTFINYYLVALGVILILASVINLPFFKKINPEKVIEINRIISKEKIFAKDYLLVRLRIKNKGRQRIDYIEVEDEYPDTFNLVLGRSKISTQLNPKSTVEFSYILQPRLRGEFIIGPSRLILYDRLRLNSENVRFDNTASILVYPQYDDVRRYGQLTQKRVLGILFGAHKSKDKGIGMDFFGIRRYDPSDELRWVDWKATAKTGKLMTREYETERNIKIMIVLDASSSMGVGDIEDNKLEYSIRAAVLLSHLALSRRDEVGLLVFSSKVKEFLEPKSGRNQIFRILDALAKVTAEGTPKPYSAIKYAVSRLQKNVFYIFLSDLEAPKRSIINAMKLIKANNSSVLALSPFGPWFEAKYFEITPVEKALSTAITEELYADRKKLIKELNKFDVPVLTVGPDDYLLAIMSEYIKAKRRGAALT